jgi:tRNA threonylcarbamoyladenosine biosynthesis protein TsaB
VSRGLKLLAIETSTTRGEVALALDDEVVASAALAEHLKPTASLAPTIRDLCRTLEWSVRDLDLVCVDIGPGSYTGLRVGLTCAKMLAYVAGAPLATAGSLDVVARNAPPAERRLEVAFDAARGQVFAERFDQEQPAGNATDWIAHGGVRIAKFEDWDAACDRSSLVLGPALVQYRARLTTELRVAAPNLWWPRAATVAALGLKQFRAGLLAPYWTMEPVYLRPSAAEEKRGVVS